MEHPLLASSEAEIPVTRSLRYVLYARKSSEEKSKQAKSIEAQLAELLPYAEREGLRVVTVLEEARTAKEPGRPLFNRMLAMMQAGEADAVLCWHLNRLTRNEKDSGELRWLLRQGVIREVRTPTRTYLPEDSAFVTAVETAAGEQFIHDLVRNSAMGTQAKLRAGGVPFKAPTGYRNNVVTKEIEPDPEVFPLLRRAVELLLGGDRTVLQVAREVPLPIRRSQWYNVLTSRFYTGYFSYKGQLWRGRYPALMSEEEFERLQALLGRRSFKHVTRHERAYAGLIACARCGHAVVADRKRKVLRRTSGVAEYTYWACGAGGRNGCRRRGVREEVIDQQILSLLERIAVPEEFVEWAMSAIGRQAEEHARTTEQLVQKQEERLRALEGERLALLRLRTTGRVDDRLFDAENARLTAEIGHAERHFEGIRSGAAAEARWESLGNAVEFAANAPALFERGDATTRGWIARQLCPRWVLRDQGAAGVTLEAELTSLLLPFQTLRAKGAAGAAQRTAAPARRRANRSRGRDRDGSGTTVAGTVRAKSLGASVSHAVLEPSETGRGSGAEEGLAPSFPMWCDWLDEVRTILDEMGDYFPPLPNV